MKKMIILILISYYIASPNMKLIAQDLVNNVEVSKNSVKLGIFQLAASTFLIGYERNISGNKSLVILTSFILKDNSKEQRLGAGGELQYRFGSQRLGVDIFDCNSLMYVGPYVSSKYINQIEFEEADDYSIDEKKYYYNSIGFGFIAGVKLYIIRNVQLDFNIGGGIKYTQSNRKYDDQYFSAGIFNLNYTGVLPRANFTLGIGF